MLQPRIHTVTMATVVMVLMLFATLATLAEGRHIDVHEFPDTRQGRFARSLGQYNIIVPQRVDHQGAFLTHHVHHVIDDASHTSQRLRRDVTDADKVHYKLNVDGKDLHVTLRPNDKLFGPGLVVERRHSRYGATNGTRSRISRLGNNKCHFVGDIKGESRSRAALATCNGLTGVLHTDRGEYFIEPVKGHQIKDGGHHPHLIYKRSALPAELDIARAHLADKGDKAAKASCGVEVPAVKEHRKRGRYKGYLNDDSQKIPKTTAWRSSNNRHQWQITNVCPTERSEDTLPTEEACCIAENLPGISDTEDLHHHADEGGHTDEEMPESPHSTDQTNGLDEDIEPEERPQYDVEPNDGHHNLLNETIPEEDDIVDRPHTCHQPESYRECSPLRSACNGDPDTPVYEASDVSKGQFLALTMAFILRYNLSGVATQDLLNLLNVLVPGCIPKTKYFLDKAFSHLQDEAEVHYYCLDCAAYVGSADQICLSCRTPIDKNKSLQKGNYFMSMPLASQLTHLMEEQYSTMTEANRADGSVYSDISSGSEYPQDDALLTLSFNCDGVPVFNSSDLDIWPIFVTVNEVPFQDRHRSIMLAALWFGKGKPHIPTFFRPFINELKTLNTTGFQWHDSNGMSHMTKVHAKICICDAPARAMVQNMKQFNGEHGCGYCLHPGKYISRGGGRARVYPSDEEPRVRRTMLDTCRLAEEAEKERTTILGVKGKSALTDIPNFNIIAGVVPDYMHAVCLGVTKQFVTLWTESSEHGSPFYIPPRKVKILNQRIAEIRPPNEVKRMPRPLTDRRFWKATEWRSFLLLYSEVILLDILPSRHLRHWSLLSSSMNALLQPTLSEDGLQQVTDCLNRFVDDIPALYGEEHVTYNCHILLHIPEIVRNWGLPWASSAFIYEDANGKLLEMYNGTRGVPQQMFKSFFARRSLLQVGDRLLQNADEAVLELFTGLTDFRVQSHTQVVNSFTKMMGKPTQTSLTVPQRVALTNSNVPLTQSRVVKSYKRTLINGRLYSTSEYGQFHKQDNSVIHLDDGSFGIIESLAVYKPHCECEGQECCCVMLVIFYHRLRKKSRQPFRYSRHGLNRTFHEPIHVEAVGTTYACGPQNVKGKCLLLASGSEFYLIQVPKFEFG